MVAEKRFAWFIYLSGGELVLLFKWRRASFVIQVAES